MDEISHQYNNSYTTGMSALPDIYARIRGQVHIYRQGRSAHGITNVFYFSMQAYLIVTEFLKITHMGVFET